MTVTGLSNPTHLLRLFLSKEYAFDVVYPTHIIRIAHRKGFWCLRKSTGDYLTVGDYSNGSLVDCANSMTRALFETLITENLPLDATRADEASVIERAMRIWAGNPNTITEFIVVQPGRNASIDQDTGDYVLSAQPSCFLA